jgi:hypothetical protein
LRRKKDKKHRQKKGKKERREGEELNKEAKEGNVRRRVDIREQSRLRILWVEKKEKLKREWKGNEVSEK